MNGKTFLLMRKNEPITMVQFSSDGKMIARSENLTERAKEIAPIAYLSQPGNWLYKWWDERSIPITRDQIQQFLSRIGYNSPGEYLVKNLGLSLTDYYWIKDPNSDMAWEDINLFDNDFHENILLQTDTQDESKVPHYTPNSSLQGNIEKTWSIVNGERCLIKGNHSGLSSESINEVIASEIHRRQGYDNHVDYDLIHIKGKPYAFGCISKAFTSQENELISAWAVCTSERKPDNKSYYDHFIDVCKKHGIDGEQLRYDLEYETITDFILTGYDRHLNNISILRNADTLKFLRMAPIYDSGDCLFANRETPLNIKELQKMEISSFRKHESDLLKLVQDPNVVDLTKLPPASYIRSMYEKDERISEKHITNILNWYEYKIDMCRKFQLSRITNQYDKPKTASLEQLKSLKEELETSTAIQKEKLAQISEKHEAKTEPRNSFKSHDNDAAVKN